MTSRPTGITILAILAALSGLLGICGVLPVFGISALLGIGGTFVAPPLGIAAGFIGLLFSLFLIVGPILQLIFAYGAWNLRAWAWWLGIIGTGISVVGTLLSVLGGVGIPTALLNGLLPIVIFVYLLLPGVRGTFKTS